MSTQIKSHKNQDVIVTKHRAHMNNILSRNSMYQFTLNSQQSQCLKTRKDNPDRQWSDSHDLERKLYRKPDGFIALFKI